jgi:glycosyltransferase involved in cell wall biosynthesis
MLRHYDQHGGGVRVYTHRILRAMLDSSTPHEFVFLYKNPDLLGTYAADARVTEAALPGKGILWWDQVEVPRAVDRYGIDVLYNPKYSLPLNARCPAAWVCHGLDWYVMPWASRRIDRLSHKFLVPRYARRADAIIAVSEITREHVIEYLPISSDRVVTVYSGVDDSFRRRATPAERASLERRYQLPPRFFLYSGAIYPPKNFTRLVQAFAKVGPAAGISLVIAGGENRFLSEHELKVPEQLGINHWVKWLGWVEPEQLPALYQMADVLLLPSLFESYGLPIVEAMASGCPVLTANRFGTQEIAGNAALLVDPESVEAIAAGMRRLAGEAELRAQLIAAGTERVRALTWARCAEQTLRVLENIAANPRRVGGRGARSERPLPAMSYVSDS